MRSFRRALAVSALLATCAVAALSYAQGKDKKDAKSTVAKGMTEYENQIATANKSFVAGMAGNALDDAIAGYRKAITLEPTRPEAHLLLAGALYQKGDLAAAEEAAGQAANRARADKAFVNHLGKALFLDATVKEAQGKTEEAKTAWKAYADFAKDNPDQPFPEGSGDKPPMAVKVFPASAAKRTEALDAYSKSVSEYAKVKELILKRQKELGIEPTPAKPAETAAPK
jgi:tetratricopeptide (TPR) repeat protein